MKKIIPLGLMLIAVAAITLTVFAQDEPEKKPEPQQPYPENVQRDKMYGMKDLLIQVQQHLATGGKEEEKKAVEKFEKLKALYRDAEQGKITNKNYKTENRKAKEKVKKAKPIDNITKQEIKSSKAELATKFTPAKTIEEAEVFAKSNFVEKGGVIDYSGYKGNLDYANRVNKKLKESGVKDIISLGLKTGFITKKMGVPLFTDDGITLCNINKEKGKGE